MIKRDINLEFFSNKGSVLRKIERLLAKGVLMDIQKLQEALKLNIGDITFSEAYVRTGRIINITVSPGNDFEHARLLNYLTAPNVLIWSAASASCALPGLYESVQLLAKNLRGEVVPYHLSDVTWTDGSLQQVCGCGCGCGCGYLGVVLSVCVGVGVSVCLCVGGAVCWCGSSLFALAQP